MALRVELSDGTQLVVRMSRDQMRDAFARAVESNGLVEVRGSNGRTWDVNPNQLLYFEEVDDVTADELERRSEDARRGTYPIRRR